MGLFRSAFVALQYVLPQRLLSRVVYLATRSRLGPWKNLLIRTLSRIYRIDLDEIARPVPEGFASFNDFFTRELKPGARPLDGDESALLCPADGRVSQCAPIDGDSLVQAKGHSYTLTALFGGREDLAQDFRDGSFLNVYLAPKNYHRVHLPLAGTLRETIYVPGRLFSVSPATVAGVPGLFARNERLVCVFDCEGVGTMVIVLVGAMLVSSIETVWDGEIDRGKALRARTFAPDEWCFERGDEIGRFNMGSTVIVVCPRGTVTWRALQAHASVRMGEAVGRLAPAHAPG